MSRAANRAGKTNRTARRKPLRRSGGSACCGGKMSRAASQTAAKQRRAASCGGRKKMSDDILNLDNEMTFALYACSKGLIQKYSPVLERLGLTYTSYLAMLALWEHDRVSISELGKKLYLDSGTLTPLLKKMERQGLIVRERSGEDERVVYISLTEAGRRLRDRAERMISALKSSLPENNTLAEALKKLLPYLYGV